MIKGLLGLGLVGVFFLCFLGYTFQNVMFPATLGAALDQTGAAAIPGYAGQFAEWMLRDGEGSHASPYGAAVVTPFDGYEGPVGFYSCGPYFIDTHKVVLTSRYREYRGWHEACQCHIWHGGIDYATVSPDLYPPLLAPISGKVVFSGWNSAGYGNLVVIENMGVRVYLAHLSSLYVVEGDLVSAGDYLGDIGSTGNSTGPHLHFEVRVRHPDYPDYGMVVDPSSVLLPGQSEPCNWAPGTGYYIWVLRGDG